MFDEKTKVRKFRKVVPLNVCTYLVNFFSTRFLFLFSSGREESGNDRRGLKTHSQKFEYRRCR
jgi:hypothetical protein